MATGDATPTVTNDPAAAPSAAPVAAAAPAPPDINTPAPAPVDVTSGTPQPNMQTAAVGSYAQTLSAEQTAAQKAADIANQPPPGPQKHQQLFRIIQAIGAGLSSAGTALATHGREGGAAETEEILGAEQQQRLQKTQAVQAQHDAQIRQQQTIAETNHALGQQFLLLATLPTDLALNDLKLPQAQAALVADKASAAKTQADFMSQHGVSTDQFSNMVSGNPQAVDPNDAKNLVTFAQQKISAASKILPSSDPFLQKAQTTLADPNSTPAQVFSAMSSVNRQLGLQQQVEEAKSKKEQAQANDPVAKLATPEALAEPGAVAAIQAKITDSNTDPKDISRLQALIPLATKAQENKLQIDRQQKQMEQDVQSGDPAVIGQSMAAGLIAPSQVLSARSMSRPFYSKVLKEANDASMKATGKPFDVAQAEAQYKYAINPQTQNTLNMVDALDKPGGVADILLQKGKDLPSTGVPKFNSWEQALSYQTGGKAVPAYMPAAIDFADMYSKIMGGGVGSDSARLQALNLVMASQTPEQRAAAVQTLQDTLKQRGSSIVRDNPTLKAMYPSLAGAPGSGTTSGAGASRNPSVTNPSAIPGLVIH